MFRKTFVAGLCLLADLGMAYGQITIAEFIKSANTEVELRLYDEQLQYLSQNPYQISMLKKMEFRTENDELASNQQEFAIRINPANPWERKSNNGYFTDYQSAATIRRELALKKTIADRYMQVIDYLHLKELKNLTNEEKSLVEKQLLIMEGQSSSGLFDARDYVELKLKEIEKFVDHEQVDLDVTIQLAKIDKIYIPLYITELNWHLNNIISVDRIEEVIDSLFAEPIASTLMRLQEQKINIAKREYEMERSNTDLGFIQTGYFPNRSKNQFGIRLGVRIPIANPNKGDMARQQLEIMERQNKLEMMENELKMEKDIIYQKLKHSISKFKEVLNMVGSFDFNAINQSLATINLQNPLITIKLKSQTLNLDYLLLRLRKNILSDYIKILEHCDVLQHQPMVNVLSNDLRKI